MKMMWICSMFMLMLTARILAQDEEFDICGDIEKGNAHKYNIPQINECTNTLEDAKTIRQEASNFAQKCKKNTTACPHLPCLRENNCTFGYQRNENGCLTCDCARDGEEDLFQSDIVLTSKAKKFLMSHMSSSPLSRRKRGAALGIRLWTEYPDNGSYIIPYTIAHNIEPQGVQAIQAAASELETHTCLRLRRWTGEEFHMHFYNGGGCSSAVGMESKHNDISLGPSCLFKDTILHEIMHSLGFWHEHSRPDRDNYVTVHLHNVLDGHVFEFDKMTTQEINSRGSPYDIRSLMHYGSFGFSRNGRPVMTELNGELIQEQRLGLSKHDIEQINSMYGCVVSTVGSNTPTCLDEGGFCAYWAATGRCSRDPGFMKEACCKSCREIAAGSTEVCQDSESSCRSWASHGDCDSNPAFMLENCCKSCKTTLCKDKHRQCSYWAFHGECTSNPSYMLKRCCKSCAAVEVPHARIHQQCVDKDVECAHWAFHGECAHNPDYMLKTCCKSCADVHG